VAYELEVRGWAEWDDDGPIPGSGAFHDVPDDTAIREIVDDPGSIEGLWMRAFDPETGEEHYWWIWTYYSLNWDEWDNLIDGSAEMYNYVMAA
jgi:hypothetical protein